MKDGKILGWLDDKPVDNLYSGNIYDLNAAEKTGFIEACAGLERQSNEAYVKAFNEKKLMRKKYRKLN